MKRNTKHRLVALAVLLGILALGLLGRWYIMTHLTVSADKVIKCGQKSTWSSVLNASELTYTIQNDYMKTVTIDGNEVHGYNLPAAKYGLVSFGTANIYVYEALTFDGKTDYYQTWTINFYTGNEVIQKNIYSAPGEFESVYVKDYIEITQADNLVLVNGEAEFYMVPER